MWLHEPDWGKWHLFPDRGPDEDQLTLCGLPPRFSDCGILPETDDFIAIVDCKNCLRKMKKEGLGNEL